MAKTYLGTKLQDLGNVEVLDPTDKIVIVKPKDEGVMQLKEFFFYVQSNLDLSNYYTTTQAKNLFAEKANVYLKSDADARFAHLDRVYSKVQADTKYAFKDTTYTKEEADGKFATIELTYPKSLLYTKDETYTTFALKTELPILPDLSPYSTTAKGDLRWAMKTDVFTKIESDARFAPIAKSYSKSETDGRYAMAANTYTKEESDTRFLNEEDGYTRTFIQNNIYFKPELYTRLESNNRFALKADVYTIASVNEQFAAKSWVFSRGEATETFAPIATTYTKTEVNALVEGRVRPVADDLAANYYTKTNADTKYATLNTTYTRTVSDGKYALISNTMTLTQLANTYYNKSQVDGIINAIDWAPYLTRVDAAATYATKATTLTKDNIQATYYTKAEVNDAIAAAKQGLETDSEERYITFGYAEERYSKFTDVYVKTESDAKYATKALTWSRTESDGRYFKKAEVTTAIGESKTQTLNAVAEEYLPKTIASTTYLTIANAQSTYAPKTASYTKAESNSRYHVKDSSYTKTDSDNRYLKVGLSSVDIVSTAAAAPGSVINLNNKHASSLEPGRIVWNNATQSLGNIRISNTVGKEAYFTLDLRPNFTTNPAPALTVTPTLIEHAAYGKLHEYFALKDAVYTKELVDGLIGEVKGNYLTTATASTTYTPLTTHTLLDGRVSALATTVTNNKTSADTTYATKADTYNKATADGRYVNLNTTKVNTTTTATGIGTGTGYIAANTRSGATDVMGLSVKLGTREVGHIRGSNVGGDKLVFNTGANSTDLVEFSDAGILHTKYGLLDSYFAIKSDTYNKAAIDTLATTIRSEFYTKSVADGKYGLKTDLTSLTGRVSTEEGKLTSLTTNLQNNYYKKTETYSKTESDNRYYDKLTNVLTLSKATGLTDDLFVNFNNTDTSTLFGGLKWSKGAEIYTLTTSLPSAANGVLEYARLNGGVVNSIFTVNKTDVWHTRYGNLSTYFALASNTYTKTEADAKYPLKTASYTKAQSDANYYTKTVSDGRYPLKTDVYTKSQTYTKTEADDKFALKSSVYTQAQTYSTTQADAKFALKTAVYTQTQTYSTTQADAKFALKTDSYTRSEVYKKTEADARYLLVSPVGTTLSLTMSGVTTGFNTEGLILDNTNTATNTNTNGKMTGGLNFKAGGKTLGTLSMENDVYYLTGVDSDGTATLNLLTVGASGIDSKAYGKLDVYFAKASEVYTRTETDAKYPLKTASYTKAESDGRYHNKTVTYTRTEMDARYPLKTASYTKAESDGKYPLKTASYTKAESDGRYYNNSAQLLTVNSTNTNTVGTGIVLNNTNTTGKSGSVSFNSSGVNAGFIYTTRVGATESVMSFHNTGAAGTSVESLKLTNAGIWHNTYGDLHTYFAKSAEYYSKVEADGRYPLKAASYTKAESDARYYTMTQADARYALKADTYTKAEADGRYYQQSVVYTKTETDAKFYDTTQANARFALKADAYTKAQSDANYHNKTVTYTRTEMDSRYPLKSASYTKAESDGRYINYTDSLITVTGNKTGGDGLGIVLSNTNTTSLDTPLLEFRHGTERTGYLYYYGKGTAAEIRFNIGVGTAGRALTVTNTGIWHVSYGDLHTYFAKASDVYTKTLTYTRTEMDSRYALKTASYTKSETDAKYPLKTASYTKAESDAKYYDTTQADARYALKAASYTKAESDAKYPLKAASYTKAEGDARYYTQTQANARYELKGVAYSKTESNSTFLSKADFSTAMSVTDVRATNQTPEWYLNTFGKGVTREFKTSTVVGITGTATYVGLNTYTYYADFSGGHPTQIAHAAGNRIFTRSGTSATAWTPWAEIETVEGAASKYYAKAQTYSTTEANAKFAYKADAYTKSVSDGRYHQKGVTYTRTEMDARYPLKTASYTKAESDAKYPLKADSYTKVESDDLYYTKAAADARYEYVGIAYTKAESDAKYPLKAASYTKSESDGRYHNKTVTYTRTEMDGRYPLKSASYTKSESDARYLYSKQAAYTLGTGTNANHVVISNYASTHAETAYIAWKNPSGMFTAYITSGKSTTSNALSFFTQHTAPSASGLPASFKIYHTKLWHHTYGDLHTYFAKAADVYAKSATYSRTEMDARYPLKSASYTKAEGDARYYTKTQSDANYHKKTVTYTRTEMDARYPLKAASYTKSESDGRYAKVWSGTQAQYNAITTKDAKTIYIIT